MLLQNLLEARADRNPEGHALWHQNAWRTYAEVERAANGVAAALAVLGIAPGDRVALLMDNSFESVAAHFGILKAGAVNVSINTDATPETLAYLLIDCGARALLAGSRYGKIFARMPVPVPELAHVLWDSEPPGPAESASDASAPPAQPCRHGRLAEAFASAAVRPPSRRIDLDLAMLVYTSGSTGKPKGVMLSHLNLVSNTKSIVGYLGVTASDRMLAVLPFHYIYGLSLLYTHFLAGGSVILENRFAYPNVVLDTLDKTGATGFAGVPSTFMILLQKSTLKKRSFSTLRYVTQAGGAMAPAIQKEVAGVFHPARLYVMYGSTEASPRLTYLDPTLLPAKWGSIGKAIPNVEVFVSDGEGRRLPRGETGEIAARGSNIMMGYWKDPEGTAEVLRDGTYFTGDLGREDEDGCLFIVGRKKDIIKAGGNRVSAKEIEEAILELPEVSEVAVIGVEDAILGEAIKALVVPRNGGLTAEKVLNHLKAVLAVYKVPKFVEFRPSLPKNAAGKILKAELRKEST